MHLMRTMKVATIMLVITATSGNCGFETGSTLLDMCSATRDDSVQFSKIAECRGYIVGVADSSRCGHRVNGYSWQTPGVTIGQVHKIVMKWLDDHPEKLHLSAEILVAKALQDAFPCE